MGGHDSCHLEAKWRHLTAEIRQGRTWTLDRVGRRSKWVSSSPRARPAGGPGPRPGSWPSAPPRSRRARCLASADGAARAGSPTGSRPAWRTGCRPAREPSAWAAPSDTPPEAQIEGIRRTDSHRQCYVGKTLGRLAVLGNSGNEHPIGLGNPNRNAICN